MGRIIQLILRLDTYLDCPGGAWLDGMVFEFPEDISPLINSWYITEGNVCSYGESSGQNCENIEGSLDGNTLTFGENSNGGGFGAFESNNSIIVNLNSWFDMSDPNSFEPFGIDYVIWDDGYDGTINNGEGTAIIDQFLLFNEGALVMRITDLNTNEVVYETDDYPDDYGNNMEPVDGFKVLKGTVNFSPEKDVDRILYDLDQENADEYGPSVYEIDSYYPNGWALSAMAIDTWGNWGLTDPNILGRDVQVRFTGDI